MRIERFSLQRKYEIMCKMFVPVNCEVQTVIIGVHGFAGDKESSMLHKLAEGVVESSGSVLICFDFPAHGESPVNELEFTVENCKKDLLAVAEYITELYPDTQKNIFATSFGGYISLLCYDMLADFKFLLRAPAIKMPDLLLNNVLKISENTFRSKRFIDCGYERKIRLSYSFYTELQEQEDLFNKDFRKTIYLFQGDRDDIVPLEVVSTFVNNNKNTELIVIPGADHRFKNAGEIETIVAKTKQILDA
ncbi:MAG: alpha/beta fold hydrolase [Clostridia bacterium]|nr:alpha/beta fold hydrolase [Clostridia bacterium]